MSTGSPRCEADRSTLPGGRPPGPWPREASRLRQRWSWRLGLCLIVLTCSVDAAPPDKTPVSEPPEQSKREQASPEQASPEQASPGPVRVAPPATTRSKAQQQLDRAAWALLADRCFACHGPDAARRQADLRLDTRESLLSERPAGPPVVPHQPDQSELLRRVTSRDPAEQMPPPEHGPGLTSEQLTLLSRWIASGAAQPTHWSFLPPRREPLPRLSHPDWPLQPLDHWVLASLEERGQIPNPVASRATLLRRLCLDLTGLPPSRELRDWYLTSSAPDAYEQLVERLLAAPQFGERVALFWLDAARYADTNGYFTDGERSMWRWRDGLLEALNANQPFDEFTLEQIAGDLLPGATEQQRLASGFQRNHPTNNETGLIDEEYRLSYAMDRLETTGTVWLGLTLNCARCHSHKFDPITQGEYYQLLAYFNQVTDQGLGQEGNSPPFISAPTGGQSAELTQAEATLAARLADWQAIEPAVREQEQQWQSALPRPSPSPPDEGEWLRLDFSPSNSPAPATPAANSQSRDSQSRDSQSRDSQSRDSQSRDSQSPRAPSPSGTEPIAPPPPRVAPELPATLAWIGDLPPSPPAGIVGPSATFDGSSHIAAHSPEFLDLERDQPFTISLWFHPGSSAAGCLVSKTDEEDFLRGFDLLYEKGRLVVHLNHRAEADAVRVKSQTPLRLEWQHVTVTYDGSSQAAGLRLYLNGRPAPWIVEVDRLQHSIRNRAVFKVGRRGDSLGYTGRIDELRVLRRAIPPAEALAWFENQSITNALATPADQRSPAQRGWLRAAYLRTAPTDWRDRHDRWQELSERVEALKRRLPTAMVMQDRPEPRITRVLTRGQYDQPAESVEPGIPAVLRGPGLPAGPGRDRLALARWLVSPDQPLTPRVIANRVWAQLFGVGLVKTVADFGLQGEAPAHPELLDRLALDFVDSGWNLKQLYRSIVTSATYRQDSSTTPARWSEDPENRRLGRGPRVRLEAEAIRDTALAVSQLLVTRLGGPSVKPWQPPGLWEAVSYNGDHAYEPDTGADACRRGLYTFWKRQSPPPAPLIWDAPTRETCLVQRARTNTPLQALALINEQLTTVASRVWAARLLFEHPDAPPESLLTHAWHELLVRDPLPRERQLLVQLWQAQSTSLATDSATLDRLLTTGAQPGETPHPVATLDRVRWGALSTVLQTLLSLDEAITKE